MTVVLLLFVGNNKKQLIDDNKQIIQFPGDYKCNSSVLRAFYPVYVMSV